MGYKRITVHDEGELSQRLAKPLTYAICVHVKAKLPPNHPECEWAIPKYFNGVPTDIVANQFISTKFASSTIDSQTQRVKEIQGGIAIGLEGDSTSFGTLGFVVKFFGESAYLTNNHVAGKAGNNSHSASIYWKSHRFDATQQKDPKGRWSDHFSGG